MSVEPRLIVQIARGGAVHRGLSEEPPTVVTSGEVVVELEAPDPLGNLDPPDVGEVVLSVPAPETLAREPDQVRRVIAEAEPGSPPLIVIVEAAEELTDKELAPVLEAAEHTPRPVILRVIRDA